MISVQVDGIPGCERPGSTALCDVICTLVVEPTNCERRHAIRDLLRFLRSQANRMPIAPTSAEKKPVQAAPKDKEAQMAAMMCSLENKDECLMCGS